MGLTAVLRGGRFFMPTPEVAMADEPESSVPEHLAQPTVNEINDRNFRAECAAPAAMPAKMNYPELQRLRAAITAAHQRYPKPIARVLEEFLRSWSDIGFRWAPGGPVLQLIDELLRPAPTVADAA